MKKSLAEWRKSKGLSQTALADMIGKTQKTISQWETGKTEPYPSDLDKIHAVLKLRQTDHILLPKDLP